MLKFLTHKLRTHSLNEDSIAEKVEERDSGTESDDEADHTDSGDFCTDVAMKWNDTDISMSPVGDSCLCGPSPPPAGPPPDDLLYDHHSSEEELEVINASECRATPRGTRRRGASSPPPAAPGKRKWPRPESDDDDTKVETPVRFRTVPPRSAEAVRPRRGAGCACLPPSAPTAPTAPSNPTAPAASRRRVHPEPHEPAPRRHRPALDFDKMQQLKVVNAGSLGAGGVRSWRGGGPAGGELSVFCW